MSALLQCTQKQTEQSINGWSINLSAHAYKLPVTCQPLCWVPGTKFQDKSTEDKSYLALPRWALRVLFNEKILGEYVYFLRKWLPGEVTCKLVCGEGLKLLGKNKEEENRKDLQAEENNIYKGLDIENRSGGRVVEVKKSPIGWLTLREEGCMSGDELRHEALRRILNLDLTWKCVEQVNDIDVHVGKIIQVSAQTG